jgi:cytoskeletal protein RodZ
VSVFTKRNALVGYVALKAAKRAARKRMPGRRKKRRSVWKLVGLGLLGLFSLGILAGLAVVLLRRQREEPGRAEEFDAGAEAESSVQHAAAEAVPEPAPAA